MATMRIFHCHPTPTHPPKQSFSNVDTDPTLRRVGRTHMRLRKLFFLRFVERTGLGQKGLAFRRFSPARAEALDAQHFTGFFKTRGPFLHFFVLRVYRCSPSAPFATDEAPPFATEDPTAIFSESPPSSNHRSSPSSNHRSS